MEEDKTPEVVAETLVFRRKRKHHAQFSTPPSPENSTPNPTQSSPEPDMVDDQTMNEFLAGLTEDILQNPQNYPDDPQDVQTSPDIVNPSPNLPTSSITTGDTPENPTVNQPEQSKKKNISA